MVRPRILCGLALFVLLTLGQSLAAQIRVGTLRGTVLDPTGAAVSGAMVRLSNRTTGFQRQTSTGPGGGFHFHNLPFDPYLLRVEAAGFQPWNGPVRVRSNLPVRSGQAGYTLAGGLGGRLGFFLAHSLAGSGRRYPDSEGAGPDT